MPHMPRRRAFSALTFAFLFAAATARAEVPQPPPRRVGTAAAPRVSFDPGRHVCGLQGADVTSRV